MNYGNTMKRLRDHTIYLSNLNRWLYNAKAPRTMSVLGGFIRYFGFALESAGKPYANRP